MTVSYLPPTRDLPPERIAAMRTELEAFVVREEPTPRWWRKRRNVTGGLVIALIVATGGGTAAAYAYLHPRAVTNVGYARCYSKAVYVPGKNFDGTTIASAVGEGNPGKVLDALDTCASLWQVGVLRAGAPRASAPPVGATYLVPALVGCTLPGGVAAIFPGPPDTCDQLGLAPESPPAIRPADVTPSPPPTSAGPVGSSP